MKPLLLIALALLPFAAQAADTPSRWGGLFGFGSSKQKGEQISSDLFPSGTQGNGVTPPVASPVPAATDESIFRGGEPQKVEPVSYAIENGQKVEKEAEKKKSSMFSFGKREESGTAENQVLSPVPAAAAPAPVQSSPIVAVPNPAPVQASPVAVLTATPTAAPAAPPATESSKDRFSWIPFLSKKKDEAPVPAFAPPTSAPATSLVASEISTPAAKPVAAAPAASVNETPKPVPSSGEPGVASFEVPKKTDQEVEKPKSEGGGILAPIAKIRPPKKEIDLTNAETIIQNGEIVAPTETAFDTTDTPATSAERRPPAVVNGVKTYSSWDDVEGKATSAADRIINQIR